MLEQKKIMTKISRAKQIYIKNISYIIKNFRAKQIYSTLTSIGSIGIGFGAARTGATVFFL